MTVSRSHRPPGESAKAPVLALQLPLHRRRVPERVLPALQLLDQARIGELVANAPSEEDADPGESVPPGVVGPRQRDPLVDRTVTEQPRVRHADVPEQSRQLGPVLVRRLRVRVAADEPVDQRAESQPLIAVARYAER